MFISVPSASSEALVLRSVELPFDGQTVSLLASVVKNPQEFYCRINNQKRMIPSGLQDKIIG